MPETPEPVRYEPSVEVMQADETELIEKIVASMGRVNRKVFEKHRHATRDAHAKSHGVLKGTLTVREGLPDELRQGLFATPRTYPIIVRFSSAPGDIQDDRIASLRGMAVKVIGVEGPRLLPGDEVTQDFLLVNDPIIPFGHVAAYWEVQQSLEKHADDPDFVKRLTVALAGGARKVLKLIGKDNETLDAVAPPNYHLLGETFHSMAALRFGDFLAKLSAAPLSESVRGLTGRPVDDGGNPSILRDLVVDFFRANEAEYELRAQLCTDLARMPVEDASVVWPEDLSPHRPIATIRLPAQEAYSPARRVYADDVLSFNPWHGIEAHRPLGSIMRIRREAYEASSRFRHEMNARPRSEPRDIGELPD
jgi:hypothetical protein